MLGVAIAQVYSLHKGLEESIQEKTNAVQSELQKHHVMETSFPVDPSKLM